MIVPKVLMRRDQKKRFSFLFKKRNTSSAFFHRVAFFTAKSFCGNLFFWGGRRGLFGAKQPPSLGAVSFVFLHSHLETGRFQVDNRLGYHGRGLENEANI